MNSSSFGSQNQDPIYKPSLSPDKRSINQQNGKHLQQIQTRLNAGSSQNSSPKSAIRNIGFQEPSSPEQSPLKKPRDQDQQEAATSPLKKQPESTQVIGRPIEIIKDKLFWVSDSKPPQNYRNSFFFNIDNDLTYFPFNKDFGPLNLAMVHRYCRELARLLRDKEYQQNRIFHYCASDKPDKMVNGAFLMGCFMVIILKCSAEKAFKMFKPYHPFFKAYRDASRGNCLYNCTLLHCLQGLEYAIKFQWYDFKTFSVKEYEYYERVENGDLNWIIPGKFVAFMGPLEKRDAQQKYGHHPDKYVEIFKKFDVKRVIRLNEPKYDKNYFTKNNIAHDDLFFVDGSTPPDEIVNDFFKVTDAHFAVENPGAIAIHCKAGLGRTGTLIGLWAMQHYQIPAEPFIGWIRIARPGSILGPQQFYLPKMEPIYIKTDQSQQKSKLMAEKLEASPEDKYKAQFGETNQASYLIDAKQINKNSETQKKNYREEIEDEQLPRSMKK